MYAYIHTHIRTIHTYIHRHTRTYIHCEFAFHAYRVIHTYIVLHTYNWKQNLQDVYKYSVIDIHRIHTFTYRTCIHTYIHTYITYIHTYIHVKTVHFEFCSSMIHWSRILDNRWHASAINFGTIDNEINFFQTYYDCFPGGGGGEGSPGHSLIRFAQNCKKRINRTDFSTWSHI